MSNRTACCCTGAAKEAQLADAIARRIRLRSALILVGLAGSELIRAGKALWPDKRARKCLPIAFIRLTARWCRGSQPGALIENEEQALAQTREMVQHGRVKSITGEWATVTAQTVCLHGDGEHALAFARRLQLHLKRDYCRSITRLIRE